MKLAGRVALVTGSSRGIGRAIAIKLAEEGAKVIVNHRDSLADAEETAALIAARGGIAKIVQADVSELEQAQALVKATLDTWGRLDILVNNAGTTRDTLLTVMTEEDWDLVINTNLKSTFNCCKAATRPMIKARYGRIINITSIVGLVGQAGQTNYAASKAGIIGFTKALAKELGPRGITVNAVAPGYIPTALTNVLSEEARKTIINNTPLQRMGTGEDVAEAVAFLASEAASFITGQVLNVDGGLVM
jgi:3-oxoacyl-[acyl-carrier protein] reductase